MTRRVFADTLFWVGRFNPTDHWAAAVRKIQSTLGTVQIVTTDEVLVEVLAALGRGGPRIRRLVVNRVKAMLSDPMFLIVPQSRETFIQGLNLYERRLDKGYSLTDCISMCTMQREGILEVLTNDAHFEQEGFTILIRK
jgi:predicted nucleic acid-binding protein